MRWTVLSDRAPRPLSALDTVPGDTPARRATSLMVAGFLLGGIASASLWSMALSFVSSGPRLLAGDLIA